jgi:hypothetical protein
MDDSSLYTGLTSKKAQQPNVKEDERISEKLAEGTALRPAEKVINAWIDEERASVCDLKTFITTADTSKEAVDKEIYARAKHLAFLNKLEANLRQSIGTVK